MHAAGDGGAGLFDVLERDRHGAGSYNGELRGRKGDAAAAPRPGGWPRFGSVARGVGAAAWTAGRWGGDTGKDLPRGWVARGAAGAGPAVQRIAPCWRGRGEVPYSPRRGAALWKLAAPCAAKSQRVAAQPRVLEVGPAGRGEVPTQRRTASRVWKLAALGRAKSAPKRRVNRMMG